MAEPMNCPEPPQHPAGCQGWTQPLHCGLGRSPAALRPRVHTTHGGLERPPLELGHGAYELLLGKGEAEMLPVGFASRVIPEPRWGGGGGTACCSRPCPFWQWHSYRAPKARYLVPGSLPSYGWFCRTKDLPLFCVPDCHWGSPSAMSGCSGVTRLPAACGGAHPQRWQSGAAAASQPIPKTISLNIKNNSCSQY